MKYRIAACVLVLVFLLAAPLAAEETFLLKGGETIVFLGDSITQNGGYVNYFEAYLLTRFPEKTFRVINHGISSETISGTSEEDHQPRRPWALPRFTRDVADWKPEVVVACFGMNDGNYHPFDAVRFKKYQQGIRTLIERIKQETNAKLILMTPPPYDPYCRRVSDADAKSFGYKFPVIDYDHTLAEYSKWLVSLRQEGQIVVDLHSAMNAHLKKRREKQVSFSLSPDAVHPNTTGHWLMAQFLLRELKSPATVADVNIDAKTLQSQNGSITELNRKGDEISFRWRSPIPMPMDSAWDQKSIALEKVNEKVNRYRLRITGLEGAKYLFIVDGNVVAIINRDELNRGVDLLKFSEFFTVEHAAELLKSVKGRRHFVYADWRRKINKPPERKQLDSKRIQEYMMLAKILDNRIHRLRQPVNLQIRVTPLRSP